MENIEEQSILLYLDRTFESLIETPDLKSQTQKVLNKVKENLILIEDSNSKQVYFNAIWSKLSAKKSELKASLMLNVGFSGMHEFFLVDRISTVLKSRFPQYVQM